MREKEIDFYCSNFMKSRFLKVFANLSESERCNVIYVSPKHGPMSWNVVELEVHKDTALGTEALEALKSMGVI